MDFIKEYQPDILLALASICFVILLFLLVTTYLPKAKKKALMFFTFSITFMLISARCSLYYQDQSFESAYFLAPFWKYLLFFNVLNVSYGFNEFVICLYKENNNENKTLKVFNIIRLILLIGHILLITNLFTGIYYSYDGNNMYHRENLYAINYMIPLVVTLIQYSMIIKTIKNTARRLMIPLILYFTLPVVGAIIQLFVQGLTLSNILMGGVAVLLYLFVIYDANLQLKEKERTEADLRLANEIQQNEIPNIFPQNSNFDLYAMMTPAKDVGGDYYDYFELDDNHIGLVIAHVSGKGIPAALNMIKTKILLRSIILNQNDPAKTLEALNDSFIDNNKLDMFVTVWFGIVNTKTGELIYANAGHEDLIVYEKDKGYDLLKIKHGVPIGAISGAKYKNNTIKLNKGDKIFIYTDGVTEAIDINNRSFGIDNLLKSLNSHKDEDGENTIKEVKKDIEKFTNSNTQFDDITMLYFKLKDNDNTHLKERFNAVQDEIDNVYDFFTNNLKEIIPIKTLKKYYVVIDEIFSNIVKYGYKNSDKEKYIDIDLVIDTKNKKIIVTFEDNGIPFNPLESEDPNIDLSANEREEGGLGIYIVKKMMDKTSYEYKNNKNIFTVEKKYKGGEM